MDQLIRGPQTEERSMLAHGSPFRTARSPSWETPRGPPPAALTGRVRSCFEATLRELVRYVPRSALRKPIPDDKHQLQVTAAPLSSQTLFDQVVELQKVYAAVPNEPPRGK